MAKPASSQGTSNAQPPAPGVLPAFEVDDLQAVIALSRTSHMIWDKNKLGRLDGRNVDLAQFAVNVHIATHDCHCSPEVLRYTLNGLSSNNAGDLSKEGHVFRPVAQRLAAFPRSDPRQIIVIVSTADGLFTNADAWSTFFSPYLDLNLWYMIHDGDATYRLFRVIAILTAITEIHYGVRRTNAAHALVQQFSGLAVGKLTLARGKSMVRQISKKRNETRIDLVSAPEEISAYSIKETPQICRWTRVGGTAFHPFFEEHEMPKIILGSTSSIACPVDGCIQTSDSKEHLIAHLMSHVVNNQCPLCPPVIATLGYHLLSDCIYHMEVHLTPVTESAKYNDNTRHECPYCYTTLGSCGNLSTHMENIHLKPTKIFDFAAKAGTIRAEDQGLYDNLLPAAKRTAGEVSLATMPEVLRSIRYDAPDLIDPRKGPPIYVPPQDGVLKLPDDMSLTPVDGAGVSVKYLAPGHNRLGGRGYSLGFGVNGSLECPFKGCDVSFTIVRDIAKHINDHLRGEACPWCPTGSRVLDSSGSRGRGLDVKHIVNHLPSKGTKRSKT